MSIRFSIVKGVCVGMIISVIINLGVIASLYNNFSYFILYSMAIIAFVTTYLFLNSKKIMYFSISLLTSVLVFVLSEILIGQAGVVNMVFKHIHGNSAELWAGDGFGVMVIYMFNLTGSLIGTVIAFVVTCIKRSIIAKKQSK